MGKKILVIAVVIAQFFVLSAAPNSVEAETDVYSGSISSTVEISRVMVFQVSSGVENLQISFPIYPSESLSGFSQSVDLSIEYNPEPTSETNYTNEFGYQYQRAEWISPSAGTVTITIHATVSLNVDLSSPFPKTAAFPLNSNLLTSYETQFLQSTSEVQSTDPSITSLANSLVSGCSTEYQAVDNIINWVAEQVSYDLFVPHTDAVWTLQNKSGVCTSYAQLSLALLRATGIPARFVLGHALGDSFTIPYDGSTFTKGWGWSVGGDHAWIEVYYPDIGWVAYDPQDSKTFVDTRHVKFGVGLDYLSGGDVSWNYTYYGVVNVSKTVDNSSYTLKSDSTSVNQIYFIASPSTKWLWTRETSPTSNPTPPQVAPEVSVCASANDNTPAFNWPSTIYSSDVTYRLQVDNDSDFLSPEISKTDLTSNAFDLASAYALSDGTWYWRVQAVNDAGMAGNWLVSGEFMIDTVPPSTASLVLPRNGTFMEDNNPQFSWVSASGADNYEFQCAVDNEFTGDLMRAEKISGCSYGSSVPMSCGTYYWRVRAGDNAGNLGGWSAVYQFTILPSQKWYLQDENYSWICVYGGVSELEVGKETTVTGEVHLDENGRAYIVASNTSSTSLLPTTTLGNILSNPKSYENSNVSVHGNFAGTTKKMPVAGFVFSMEGLLEMLKFCAIGLLPAVVTAGMYLAIKPKKLENPEVVTEREAIPKWVGVCESCGAKGSLYGIKLMGVKFKVCKKCWKKESAQS